MVGHCVERLPAQQKGRAPGGGKMQSDHLDSIINKQHGAVNATVVFIDIVKYSLRKSIMQQKIIQEFNEILKDSITTVAGKHIAQSQKQDLNLSTDLVVLPTGDGALVVFPFEGLQGINLDFSLDFLNKSVSSRKDIECKIFSEQGWCNCHSFFDVRIGVAEGKAIIYKDYNGSYNVAGSTVNIASRVMNLCDRQNILFTESAYKSLIDMTEDTKIESRFSSLGLISVKHGAKVDVYQYVGDGENFLNRETPIEMQIIRRRDALEKANPAFFRNSSGGYESNEDKLAALEIMEILKDVSLPFGPPGGIPELNKENAHTMAAALKLMSSMIGNQNQPGLGRDPPPDK